MAFLGPMLGISDYLCIPASLYNLYLYYLWSMPSGDKPIRLPVCVFVVFLYHSFGMDKITAEDYSSGLWVSYIIQPT